MLSILVYFSAELCWHILCHDRVSIWLSLDAKTLDFKLLLQTCEIDLFAYPTLTKRPGTIKLIKNITKSDIYKLFYLKI